MKKSFKIRAVNHQKKKKKKNNVFRILKASKLFFLDYSSVLHFADS